MNKESLRIAIDKAFNDDRNHTYKTQLKRIMQATFPFTEELMYLAWQARGNGYANYMEFRNSLSGTGILPSEVFYQPVEEFLKPALIPISQTIEIDSSKLIQSFRDSEGKEQTVTNWFNCSIARYHGKLYFAYRMDFFPFAQQMKIGLCRLNEDFTVIEGTNVMPELTSNWKGWHVEDPRLFIHQDNLYLSYTDGYQMGQAQINPETLQAEESFYLRKKMGLITEKNWVFFTEPATGKLYSIYVSLPYTILEMNGNAHTKSHVAQIPPVWTYGKISGGASPVLHGKYLYHFFHSSLNRDDSSKSPVRRQYFCGCYVMESTFPFKVVAMTTKPLLAGEAMESTIPRLSKEIYVVFPGGAIRNPDGWTLAFGYNDYRCRIANISDTLLEDNLQWFTENKPKRAKRDWSEVTKLHGWCTEGKMRHLYDLILESDSQLTVELGVFGGRSLFPMAFAHKDKGSGMAIGIDSYSKEDCVEGSNHPDNNDWWESLDLENIYTITKDWIGKNSLEDYCSLKRMRSDEAPLMFEDDSIDVLHQDSNHNQETILKEIELWLPKLKKGGYWVADDTDWPESIAGYSKFPDYGLKLVEDFSSWQIWQKQ